MGNPADPVAGSISSVALAWAEAWNSHDADRLASLFTEEAVYEDHAFQVILKGRQGVAQWMAITVGAIPDAKVDPVEVFQTADRVAIRWVFRGTPKSVGEVQGTGKSFAVPVATLLELTGGRVVRASDYYNLADLLRQVGLPADTWTPRA